MNIAVALNCFTFSGSFVTENNFRIDSDVKSEMHLVPDYQDILFICG